MIGLFIFIIILFGAFFFPFIFPVILPLAAMAFVVAMTRKGGGSEDG